MQCGSLPDWLEFGALFEISQSVVSRQDLAGNLGIVGEVTAQGHPI